MVHSYHMKIAKFQRLSAGVRLRDLYFVYAAVALVFGFHGFYMDSNWDRLQLDGNRLVMHVRLYSLLGLGAWIVGAWVTCVQNVQYLYHHCLYSIRIMCIYIQRSGSGP